MRCWFVLCLMVLLPLRGWAADAMALQQVQPPAAAHSLCPDHLPAPSTSSSSPVVPADVATSDEGHGHCTACQLPALSLSHPVEAVAAMTGLQPPAPTVALVDPSPRRQIKPPIA